jgi:hypothetical protein
VFGFHVTNQNNWQSLPTETGGQIRSENWVEGERLTAKIFTVLWANMT